MVLAGGTIEGVNGDVWVNWSWLDVDGGGGRGWQIKAAGWGLLFFRMGHDFGLQGQEARCFLKAFLLINLTAEDTQDHSILTEDKNLWVCRLFIFSLQLITISVGM
jgi:hypothetical protein